MLERYICEGLNILRVYGVINGFCTCKIPGCKHPGKHPAAWASCKLNKGVYNAKPASECQASDFHAYNLGVACGNGIIVVDIDPRNGGHLAWHELSRGQYLPDTWIVSTGSGGTHIYYRLPESMTIKSQSFRGIDIQSTGKYVVAPPSMHRDGIAYTWSDDSADSIAQIPPWLVELLKGHERSVDAAIIDDETGGFVTPGGLEWPLLEDILSKLTPRIGYDNWLAVGMGLHSTGAPQAFNLWDTWSAKDPEQYSADDCKRKWNSFKILPGQRYTYRYLYSLAEMYGISYGDDEFFANWKSEPIEVLNPKDHSLAIHNQSLTTLDHGDILNNLCIMINDNARKRIPIFSLASALQILSAAAQCSYKTWDGTNLALYQWLAASSAAGKDSYVTNTSNFIEAIHKHLLCGDVPSSGGLRVSLNSFNSRVYVKDEWHEDYLEMARSNQAYSKQLLGDFKKLFNGHKLPESTLKTSQSPEIPDPLFGIMGVGTRQGLEDCSKTRAFIASGMASRFFFWVFTEQSTLNLERKDFDGAAYTDVMAKLRKIFKVGQTGSTMKSIQNIQSDMVNPPKGGSNNKHIPMVVPIKTVGLTPESKVLFDEMQAAAHNDSHSMADDTNMSIVSRRPLKIAKLACLRALSDMRERVQPSDLEWAFHIAKASESLALEFFDLSVGGTQHDDDKLDKMRRVRGVIERGGGPITLKHLLDRARLPLHECTEAIHHLVAGNVVRVLDRKGNQVYSLGKLLPDMTFGIRGDR